MLHIGNTQVPVCHGHGFTRRSFLQAGAAGLAGMTLPNLLSMEAAGAVDPGKSKIKNCTQDFPRKTRIVCTGHDLTRSAVL